MHKVNINKNNLKVTNYDTNTRPFEFCVCIENIDNICKTIETKMKVYKTDEFGNKLFYTNANNKYIELNENEIGDKEVYPIVKVVKTISDVKLFEHPNEFDLFDIIESKKSEILEKYNDFNVCYLYENNLHELVDFYYEYNSSNSGFKMIEINSLGKVKLDFDILDENITEIKFLLEEKLNISYSINGESYMDYNDFIKGNSNIETLSLIITNPNESKIKLNNICLLMR